MLLLLDSLLQETCASWLKPDSCESRALEDSDCLVSIRRKTMSARRVIIHRGLCGVSLRTQCLGIAGTYTFISSIGVFLASLMLHSPASYVRLEEAITKEHHDTSAILVTNTTDIG